MPLAQQTGTRLQGMARPNIQHGTRFAETIGIHLVLDTGFTSSQIYPLFLSSFGPERYQGKLFIETSVVVDYALEVQYGSSLCFVSPMQFTQRAWNYCNDSCRLDLCVRFDAEVIVSICS